MPGTIKTTVETEIEISRSRFITVLSPITSTDEARQAVADARDRFPDARHHCSAGIHREAGEADREHSSDDGEPSGTAGRPMLDVLRGHDLTDVCAVVIRYFGGVLLGTGGLVRAYSDSVATAVDAATIYDLVEQPTWSLHCHPGQAGRLESVLRSQFEVEAFWSNDVRFVIAAHDPSQIEALASSELGEQVRVEQVGSVDVFTLRTQN